jgi:hypothetical protein
VQNRKYLIYFGSQKTRTEFHNGSFGSVSLVPVLDYFGSVPRFRFFLPRPNRGGRGQRLVVLRAGGGLRDSGRGLKTTNERVGAVACRRSISMLHDQIRCDLGG